MSAVGAWPVQVSRPWGRWRRYGPLLRALLWAQIVGSLALGLAVTLLQAVHALVQTPGAGVQLYHLYLPWPIDGAWSALAAVGWGALVAFLIGLLARNRAAARLGVRLRLGACVLAVAAGGYGAMGITGNGLARLSIAALATPAILLVLALEPSGAARGPAWDARIPRRTAAGLLVACGLLLVSPYSVTHQFVVDEQPTNSIPTLSESIGGYEETESNLTVWVTAGRRIPYTFSVENQAMATTITGLHPEGAARGLRIDAAVLEREAGVSGPVRTAVRLPLHLPRSAAVIVAYTVDLPRCPSTATIGAFRLSYEIAGIALSQRVTPERSLTLACWHPGGARR